MAGPRPIKGESKPDGTAEPLAGARVLIVEARYYEEIADALLEGAVRALNEAGASHECVTVPGALEIPAAIAIALDAAAARGKPYEGAVALGCVIRGETFHFEIVAEQSGRALMDLSVARTFPLGNGILTVESEAQAFARARTSEGDKGGDAARAALALIRVRRGLAGTKR